MPWSFNETAKLVKDAARGSGLPVGDAEELARIAVWLEVAGLAGLPNACRAIDEHLTETAARVELIGGEEWQLKPRIGRGDGRISSLSAAVSAKDLVISGRSNGATQRTIRINAAFLPMIIIGAVASLPVADKNALTVNVQDARRQTVLRSLTTPDQVLLEETPAEGQTIHPLVDVTIMVAPFTKNATSAMPVRPLWTAAIEKQRLDEGLSPDPHALETLRAFAQNCLVPATEASRLKGAGAGTVDRD